MPEWASAPPTTSTRGRDALDSVVRAGEQALVADRGDILARRAELRRPEQVQVRLVADDHVLQAREAGDDAGEPGRESRLLGGHLRRLRAAVRIGVEVDVDPGGRRLAIPVRRSESKPGSIERLALLPGDRHPRDVRRGSRCHQCRPSSPGEPGRGAPARRPDLERDGQLPRRRSQCDCDAAQARPAATSDQRARRRRLVHAAR